MSRIRFLLPIIIVGFALGVSRSQTALADAAPDPNPPGATVDTGGVETNVQMLAEEVMIILDNNHDAIRDEVYPPAPSVIGHVEATFWMQNQGEEEEAFDVWFPLEYYAYDDFPIKNFAVSVNGVPTEVDYREAPTEDFVSRRWAAWPTTFPPGQMVILHITYDMYPSYFDHYVHLEFLYILETGAGWWGPINQGTITVRLPYEVNEFNTGLDPEVSGYPYPDFFTVSGTNVTWNFTDLEPTRYDNVRLRILEPTIWEEIVAAEQEVAANPDSAEAHFALATAWSEALAWHHGLLEFGNSLEVVSLAEESYLRAIELDPDNVDYYVPYLELMRNLCLPIGRCVYVSEYCDPIMERALTLDPNNERLLGVQEWFTTLTPTPTLTPSPTFTPRSTWDPTSSPLPTAVRPPSATPPPAPTITPTPTPSSSASSSAGVLAGALAVMLMLTAAVWMVWRRRR